MMTARQRRNPQGLRTDWRRAGCARTCARTSLHRGAWLVCIALFACGRGEAPPRATVARTAAPREVITSEGALASRREAQASFDEARANLTRGDFEGAATALSDAATFLQAEVPAGESDAKEPLVRSAEELDRLAVSVAHREVRAARALDAVFARAHGAEAVLHLTRAHSAMTARENIRAGEELLMSVDHLERAAKDAHIPCDSSVRTAIANTRSLAIEMAQGMEAVPDEAARVSDGIERAVRRVTLETSARAR